MCPLTALIPGTKPLKSRLRVVAVFGIKSEEAAYFHPSLFRGRCEWNQKKWLKLIFCSSCCRHQSKVGDVLAFFLWIFLYLSRIRAVIWLEIHLKMPILVLYLPLSPAYILEWTEFLSCFLFFEPWRTFFTEVAILNLVHKVCTANPRWPPLKIIDVKISAQNEC